MAAALTLFMGVMRSSAAEKSPEVDSTEERRRRIEIEKYCSVNQYFIAPPDILARRRESNLKIFNRPENMGLISYDMGKVAESIVKENRVVFPGRVFEISRTSHIYNLAQKLFSQIEFIFSLHQVKAILGGKKHRDIGKDCFLEMFDDIAGLVKSFEGEYFDIANLRC